MKPFLVIVMALVLSSCGTLSYIEKPRDRVVVYTVYDFKPYSQKGFYFSPNPYPGNFEPVGQIYISIYPAKKEVKEKNEKEGFGETNEYNYRLEREKITAEEMLEIIYDKAKSLGADGVVNFNIKWIYTTYTFNGIPREYFDRYEVEGFAIKRK